MGHQVRVILGGEELAVVMTLLPAGDRPSLAAIEVLRDLIFQVQELSPGVPTVGTYNGDTLAAELVARALVHQHNTRREEPR